MSLHILTDEPLAVAAIDAIHTGDLPALKRLLAENPDLAQVRLGDNEPGGMSRTLLHVATDWPGHFPNGAATVAVLIEAGAEVNARFSGPHTETPLHWAASSASGCAVSVPGQRKSWGEMAAPLALRPIPLPA
jgi:hypothetical protein